RQEKPAAAVSSAMGTVAPATSSSTTSPPSKKRPGSQRTPPPGTPYQCPGSDRSGRESRNASPTSGRKAGCNTQDERAGSIGRFHHHRTPPPRGRRRTAATPSS